MFNEDDYTEIARANGHDDVTYIMWQHNNGGKRIVTNDIGDVLDSDVQCTMRQWIHDWTR